MASIVWDSSNTRASMLANPFNNIRTPIVCSVPTTLASMTVVVWHVTNTGPPNVMASMLRVPAQVGAVAVVHPVVVAEALGPHLLALEVEGRVLLVAVFVHLSAEHGDKTGWCKVPAYMLPTSGSSAPCTIRPTEDGKESSRRLIWTSLNLSILSTVMTMLNLCFGFSDLL